jgi:hypothetical protein
MAVYGIAVADSIGVVVGNGLCPRLVAGRVTTIPVLELDGIGQNKHHPVNTVGLNYILGSITAEIHPVEVLPPIQ